MVVVAVGNFSFFFASFFFLFVEAVDAVEKVWRDNGQRRLDRKMDLVDWCIGKMRRPATNIHPYRSNGYPKTFERGVSWDHKRILRRRPSRTLL